MKTKTLYHGTSSLNLSCIKTLGLVPGHAKGGDAWARDHHMMVADLSKAREPSVFVSDEVGAAEDFARYAVEENGGDPIVVTLHVPQRVFETYVEDELFDSGDGAPHAWRAHSVDVAYVGEVLPVSQRETPNGFELLQLLRSALRSELRTGGL
jgi:hypothetical protein